MAVAGQMKDVVDRLRIQFENLGVGENPLPEVLREPLEELERYATHFCYALFLLMHLAHRCIAKSLEALNACKAGSKRRRGYLYRSDLSHELSELSGIMKQCSVDMKSALDLLNVRPCALVISSD